MYAVEFEADIHHDGILRVPIEYKEIYKTHAKVMITVEDTKNIENKIDFSVFKISSFKNIDHVEFQRQARDEW